MEKLYTCKETSEITGIKGQTLRQWDRDGKFKGIRFVNGGNLFYTQKHIDFLKDKIKFTGCDAL